MVKMNCTCENLHCVIGLFFFFFKNIYSGIVSVDRYCEVRSLSLWSHSVVESVGRKCVHVKGGDVIVCTTVSRHAVKQHGSYLRVFL